MPKAGSKVRAVTKFKEENSHLQKAFEKLAKKRMKEQDKRREKAFIEMLEFRRKYGHLW